jgi:hypothetical protein
LSNREPRSLRNSRDRGRVVKLLAMCERHAETPAERLRTTFELIDVAERLLRQRVRREFPDISEQALEERVSAWYERRPGAEFGDGEGIPVAWPRR